MVDNRLVTAVLRARVALHAAGLGGAALPTRAMNSTKEVWFADPFVVRLNPGIDERRLEHEHRVMLALPDDFPAPPVCAYGRDRMGEWLIIGRMPGTELSRAWPTMSENARSDAIHQLGAALKRLHAVDAVAAGLGPASWQTSASLECPHQLPVSRTVALLAEAATLPFMDTKVLAAATDLARRGAHFLDASPRSLIHGDLHFENVLWDGKSISAIIDFEWARPGSPDLDLDVLLHSLADPAVHVAADYDAVPSRDMFDKVARWMREAYPELFAHPHLAERLAVYRLAYDIRDLLAIPPDRTMDRLAHQHPLRRIQRLVEGRSDLAWALAG